MTSWRSILVLFFIAASVARSDAGVQPNLFAEASERFLNIDHERRPIDRKQPVNHVAQGMRVSGEAHITGRVHAQVVPCQDHAVVDITFQGHIKARTASRKRLASVVTDSTTEASASKRIELWNLDQVQAAPATATCKTEATIRNLSTRLQSQVFRDLVRDTAYNSKQSAEEAAAIRAERQICGEIDDLFENSKKRALFGNAISLIKNSDAAKLPTPQTMMRSTESHVCYYEHRLGPGQSQRWETPPTGVLGQHDLTIMCHESWFSAVSDALLADQWVTDEQIADGLQTLFGSVPREYRLGTHMQRWSLHLDPKAPLTIRLDAGNLLVTLRVQEAKVGEELITCPFEILVGYSIAPSSSGPELARLGKPQVILGTSGAGVPNRDEYSAFLTQKAADAFGELLYFDGLAIPEGGQFENFTRLQQAVTTTKSGWLILSWDVDPNDPGHVATAK